MAGLVLCSLSSSLSRLAPKAPSFASTYEHKLHQAQSYILRPLFFASIGFAIPIKSLFGGRTVWQGVVYSVVSLVAKLVCGAFVLVDHTFAKWRRSKGRKAQPAPQPTKTADTQAKKATFPPSKPDNSPRQPSLWPVATLLGSAMVARGEISLLIVNVAREASPELMPDELFYLAIWATLLCTIIGPVVVGLIVKQLERTGGMLPATWGPQGHRPATTTPVTTANAPAQSVAT